MKLSLTVSKLWSGHECSTAGRTDGQTDGRTDTQKFGGYNIIPRHCLWRGIKIREMKFIPYINVATLALRSVSVTSLVCMLHRVLKAFNVCWDIYYRLILQKFYAQVFKQDWVLYTRLYLLTDLNDCIKIN